MTLPNGQRCDMPACDEPGLDTDYAADAVERQNELLADDGHEVER